MFKLFSVYRNYLKTLEAKDQLEVQIKSMASSIRIKENELKSNFEIKEQKLKHDFDMKLAEEKLKIEQLVARKILELEKKLSDKELVHAEEISKIKSQYSEDHYNKLSTALNDLHSKGNVTTQFVQEMALKMVEKANIGESSKTISIEHINLNKDK